MQTDGYGSGSDQNWVVDRNHAQCEYGHPEYISRHQFITFGQLWRHFNNQLDGNMLQFRRHESGNKKRQTIPTVTGELHIFTKKKKKH